MNLEQRIGLLSRLGEYMLSDDKTWQEIKTRASQENTWFIPEFIEIATGHIARAFLHEQVLREWIAGYTLSAANARKVGIVMAGNIPLVGFHDLLCVFLAGHIAIVKPSSKDDTLIRHLAGKLNEWPMPADSEHAPVQFASMLQRCDAYIATGSNNSAGYFEYYFKKYPHIIRRNRTSVAVLTGNETPEELARLADDVFLYFGLGCRNVTKIYVPTGYDFRPFLDTFRKYDYLADYHKYKNNYDYNLAILILNKKFYMGNASVLLVEEPSFFSPISQLHYEYYDDRKALITSLKNHPDIQCIAGEGFVPFGSTQYPSIREYADGVDTLDFACRL